MALLPIPIISGFVSIVPIRRTSQLVVCEAAPKKADSAAKRARQSKKRCVYNKAKKSEFKTWIKKARGKVVIVTGGASGIGESTTHLFWKNGAKVVIADIQDELGQAISDKLGENVCYIHCDVSNEEEVINLVDTTVAKFGHLDIMFNNAGILDRPYGSILDTTKLDLERVLRVNVVGSFLGAKHATRVMVPQRKGSWFHSARVAYYSQLAVITGFTNDLITGFYQCLDNWVSLSNPVIKSLVNPIITASCE
ncbi:hypothetical protein RJ640_015585 [Escallonia rubra]|uniref:Uncharacterized protein n=1 Tax=Escallonia rubra TaxID=112253 RepID=A0AA88QUL9_9ASTE|nr:hypothetical protein RJ640_015585 [Escallonia rubra]